MQIQLPKKRSDFILVTILVDKTDRNKTKRNWLGEPYIQLYCELLEWTPKDSLSENLKSNIDPANPI